MKTTKRNLYCGIGFICVVAAVAVLFIAYDQRQQSQIDAVHFVNFVSGLEDKSDAAVALALANDGPSKLLSKGSALFQAQCSRCHGVASKIPQHTPLDLLNIVSHGLPNKGMPAWSRILTKQQIIFVSSHVIKQQQEAK